MKKVLCVVMVLFMVAGFSDLAMSQGKSTAKLMVDTVEVKMSKKAKVGLSGQGFKPGEEVAILFTAVDGVTSDIGFALDPQPVADTWNGRSRLERALIVRPQAGHWREAAMPAETMSQLLATIVAYVPIAAGAWRLFGKRRFSA